VVRIIVIHFLMNQKSPSPVRPDNISVIRMTFLSSLTNSGNVYEKCSITVNDVQLSQRDEGFT
jgi:hypothetical protein